MTFGFPLSKKNTFRGNYSRKYGKQDGKFLEIVKEAGMFIKDLGVDRIYRRVKQIFDIKFNSGTSTRNFTIYETEYIYT